MNSVVQDQLSEIARSIADRAEQANRSSEYDVSLSDLATAGSAQEATLVQQVIDLKASFSAERALHRAVVERLEREVAMLRGEVAAFVNERAEAMAQTDRLNRESRQAIDAMMAQVTAYLEERA